MALHQRPHILRGWPPFPILPWPMQEQPGAYWGEPVSLLPAGQGGMPVHLPGPANALQPCTPLMHQGPGSKLRMSVLANSYLSVEAPWAKPPPSAALGGALPSLCLKRLHCVQLSCS